MEANPKTKWVRRLFGAAPWPMALLMVLLTLQVADTLPTRERATKEARNWALAGRRVDARLGVAEAVLVHPAGRVSEAQQLRGLPLICDEGGKRSSIGGSRRDGLWILGNKSLSQRLKKALGRLGHRGTIRYDSVFIHHGWNPEAGKR